MGGPAKVGQRHFENLTDPRVDRGFNHDLLEMIFVALTAAICGANGWADVERFAKAKLDWFRQYVELPHGVPSHDTFGRVFARLDTGEFLCVSISGGHASIGRSVRRVTARSGNRHRREDAAGVV